MMTTINNEKYKMTIESCDFKTHVYSSKFFSKKKKTIFKENY